MICNLIVTVTTPVSTYTGLLTEPAEFESVEQFRNDTIANLTSFEANSLTLIDGDKMHVFPKNVLQNSVISFQIVEAA